MYTQLYALQKYCVIRETQLYTTSLHAHITDCKHAQAHEAHKKYLNMYKRANKAFNLYKRNNNVEASFNALMRNNNEGYFVDMVCNLRADFKCWFN